MKINFAPIFNDFCKFATAQIVSGDLDPAYPVLKRLYDTEGLTEEVRLWRTLIYVTWYSLSSAEQVWKLHPSPREVPPIALPTGVERRAFRGNQLSTVHLNAVFTASRSHGSLAGWVNHSVAAGGTAGWQNARSTFMGLPYGGPWSSYKWADLLKNVHGYPITAADIGVGGGGETAGPVPGMVRITGLDWKRVASDVELQQYVHDEAVQRGVPFNGLDMLETACCDFNSLCKGGYYVGHDVDVQQEAMAKCSPELNTARRLTFEKRYLGELNGWNGVRKHLKGVYAKTGEVIT